MRYSDRVGGLQPSAIREMFKLLTDSTVISFAAGSPSPETFPGREMSGLAAELLGKEPAQTLQYGVTEGYPPLLEQTRRRLSERYGLNRAGDDLMMCSGGQQAIELCAKVLLNEGDTVLCENPSFVGALNAFRSYGARLIGVPMDESGLLPDELEAILKRNERVRLLYTIPTFQNPTGRTLSLERRKRVLELSERYDFIILEDDPYRELRYSGEDIPAIKSMDEAGRVVYAGSYSKVISPGLRVGYALADAELISKMVVCKQCADVHVNQLGMRLVSAYLEHYDLDEHIASCRELYRSKRDAMLAACSAFDGLAVMSRPDGGLFLWGELAGGVSGDVLCRAAASRKVACVPGSTFAADGAMDVPGFRLNFSTPSLGQIETGMRHLAEAMRAL